MSNALLNQGAMAAEVFADFIDWNVQCEDQYMNSISTVFPPMSLKLRFETPKPVKFAQSGRLGWSQIGFGRRKFSQIRMEITAQQAERIRSIENSFASERLRSFVTTNENGQHFYSAFAYMEAMEETSGFHTIFSFGGRSFIGKRRVNHFLKTRRRFHKMRVSECNLIFQEAVYHRKWGATVKAHIQKIWLQPDEEAHAAGNA